MKYHLALTKHDRDMGTSTLNYTYATRAERDVKIDSVYAPDQEVDCDTGLFHYTHTTWEEAEQGEESPAPELTEALRLAKNLGREDLTGYIVCTITDENVQMALKLEDADLFALWAHLAGVLLSGVSDKPAAMRAMATALAMHGFEANVRSDRPAGNTH